MVSYGDALYAIGGYHGGELNTMEKYTRGTGWTYAQNLPYVNHRQMRSKHHLKMATLSVNQTEIQQTSVNFSDRVNLSNVDQLNKVVCN